MAKLEGGEREKSGKRGTGQVWHERVGETKVLPEPLLALRVRQTWEIQLQWKVSRISECRRQREIKNQGARTWLAAERPHVLPLVLGPQQDDQNCVYCHQCTASESQLSEPTVTPSPHCSSTFPSPLHSLVANIPASSASTSLRIAMFTLSKHPLSAAPSAMA